MKSWCHEVGCDIFVIIYMRGVIIEEEPLDLILAMKVLCSSKSSLVYCSGK